MAKYEWMNDEIIKCVSELFDKLSDVDLAIENLVDTMKYELDTDDDEIYDMIDSLSWDYSGSIGDLMNNLEDMFGDVREY